MNEKFTVVSQIGDKVHWLPTFMLVAPHAPSRWDQVADLANQFSEHGWDRNREALVGYFLLGEPYVQLLSGSHRFRAATLAGISVPVVLRDYLEVEEAYGDVERWRHIMRAPVVARNPGGSVTITWMDKARRNNHVGYYFTGRYFAGR